MDLWFTRRGYLILGTFPLVKLPMLCAWGLYVIAFPFTVCSWLLDVAHGPNS